MLRLLLSLLLTLILCAQPSPRIGVAVTRATTSPVLLVLNDTPAAPFGAYLAELLRYEGFAVFDTEQLGDVNATLIGQYPLVILAETALTPAQAQMFRDYVIGGGRLIAMRPHTSIAALFGLLNDPAPLANGYVRVTPSAVVNGELLVHDLITDTLQVLAPADRFALDTSAIEVARLYSDASTPTPFPAVAARVASSSGGIAAAFTYDLARNVAYLRQGRVTGRGPAPASAPVTRTAELYEGWTDLNRIEHPQADEQLRLLGRLVRALTRDRVPLPQAWYFPGRARTVMIASADSYASLLTEFTAFSNTVSALGAGMSFYTNIGDLSDSADRAADIAGMKYAGHSAGVLMYSKSNDPALGFDGLAAGFVVLPDYFTQAYGISPSLTYHSVQGAWEGWTTAAELAGGAGMRMALSADHIGRWLRKPDGKWARGHITGGGRPLPYVRADGTLLPVMQQPVQIVARHLTDIQGSDYEGLALTGEAIAAAKSIVERSVMWDYAALTINMNVNDAYASAQRWLSETLTHAAALGAPTLSADAWLRFNLARQRARYTDVVWDPSQHKLSFNLVVSNTPGVSLTTLLPPTFAGGTLVSVTVDGAPVDMHIELVRQQPMAFFSATAAPHNIVATYRPDAPLSGLSAVNSSPTDLYKPVVFTATVAAGSNPSFIWDFGDGSYGVGGVVTHTYRVYPGLPGSPGAGTIQAVVRASNGQTSGAQALVFTSTVRLRLPVVAHLPMVGSQR